MKLLADVLLSTPFEPLELRLTEELEVPIDCSTLGALSLRENIPILRLYILFYAFVLASVPAVGEKSVVGQSSITADLYDFEIRDKDSGVVVVGRGRRERRNLFPGFDLAEEKQL